MLTSLDQMPPEEQCAIKLEIHRHALEEERLFYTFSPATWMLQFMESLFCGVTTGEFEKRIRGVVEE